jgi:hypothetical protein
MNQPSNGSLRTNGHLPRFGEGKTTKRDGRAKGVENEEEDETGELQPADGKPRALKTEEEDEHEL